MPTFEASAPGRCGIIGNPTDIYGGVVVSCSVSARAKCRLTMGRGEKLPEDTRLWNAAVARYPLEGPVEVEWSTEIPRSSGISGSTALLASTLACVFAAKGEQCLLQDKPAFAETVRDVEYYEAKVVCGFQDAYMIVHGGVQRMDFRGKRPDKGGGPHASLTPLDVELPFLLITTGVERLSGSVHGPMSQRWLNGERAVIDAMDRISQLGVEGADKLQGGDWSELARLMQENQALIASVGGSGDSVDLLVERSLGHGALAVKLAGAGLGGTVIALTFEPEELEERLRREGYSRFMKPSPQPGVALETNLK